MADGDDARPGGEPSPWASDRIPPAAPSVVWDTPTARTDESSTLRSTPDSADTDSADTGQARDGAGSRWGRPARWVASAVGVVAVVAIVAAAVVSLRDDDVTDESTTDDAPATSAELDTLPDPDDADDEDPDDEDSDDADEEDGGGDDRVDGGTAGGIATGSDAASTTIELPPAIAAIDQPTEILALTTTGDLHTVSLPSGTVRTVSLGSANGGASLSVSPDAALVASYQGGATVLVPRSEPPIAIDRDDFALDGQTGDVNVNGYGWIPDGDDSTAILAIGFASNSNSQQLYLIRNDGTVEVDPTEFASSNFSFILPSAGARIANDAGGVYRIGPDGSTRISDGHAIAGSDTRALIRECDEQRNCRYVLQALDGSDVTPLPAESAAAIDSSQYGATLSPDGSALAYTVYAQQQQRVVVDLATGETVRSDDEQGGFGFGDASAWALDGSGLFVTGGPEGGLAFLDRATGEVAPFADDLGQVMALGVRYPDSELVERSLAAGEVAFSRTPAAPIGLEIVTVGQLGAMTHVDLDDATTTSWETPGVRGNPPPRLFADADQVLAVSGNGSRAFVSGVGTATEVDDTVLEPPFLHGPTDDTIWSRSPAAALDVEMVMVGLDGEPRDDGIGVAVDDATLLGEDGAGSLVIAAGGDVYLSAGGDAAGFTTGLDRLTTGEVLAIGIGHALVRECDAVRSCTTLHLERSTGEPSGLDTSAVAGAHAIDADRDVSTAGSISPDGAVVLVESDKSGTGEDPPTEVGTWSFVDLTTGIGTNVTEPTRDQPVVWNDDSTYAAFATEDGLFLYERSTATVIEVLGVSDVRAMTGVDASFAASAPGDG